MTHERLADYQQRILRECSTGAAVTIVLHALVDEAQAEAVAAASAGLVHEFTEQALACKALAESLREATGDATADAQRTDARRQAYAREDTWQQAANRIAALFGEHGRHESRSISGASTTGDETQ